MGEVVKKCNKIVIGGHRLINSVSILYFRKKLVDKFFFIKYTLSIKIFINQNFDTSNYYFLRRTKTC